MQKRDKMKKTLFGIEDAKKPLCVDCKFFLYECWKIMEIPKWCQDYFEESWIGNPNHKYEE